MFTREERSQIIERLEKEFNEAKGIYLTNIDKIDVNKISQLRAELRKNDLTYVVVKNTLARIAAERSGKGEIASFLKGPTGVVIAKNEPTIPAKIIKEFRKTNKDLLDIKAAYVEGAVFNAEQTERLADIPSREVLLSQLLSVLQAPVANLAGALGGILTKFVGTLEAVKNQKEQA
jgi:large subunit ribosomal protein L10